jgi:hypothetical protein
MVARKLYHTSGCSTVDNLKMMICMNQIKNCPVTVTDVTNATKIWGPDIGALKGKTTRRTPSRVRQDDIDIPHELKARFDDVVLCVDLMYAQGIPILTTIDKTIRFRGVVPMRGKKAKQMYEALDVVLRQYNKAGSMGEKGRVRVLVRPWGHNPKCRLPRTRAAAAEAMLACRTTAC